MLAAGRVAVLPSGFVHVSLFTLRPEWTARAAEVCAEMRERLLAFHGHPGVRSLDVVTGDARSTAHIALLAVYDSEDSLAALRRTPEHDELIAWAGERFDLDGRADVNETRG